MTTQEIVKSLSRLARRASDNCASAEASTALTVFAERLELPLQVAVGGRMKAGKSTLVNALLGREIAPTAATECTLVVARYMYDDAEGVQVQPREGSPYALPPTASGGPPDELGLPASEISHVTVRMSSTHRRAWTLVDTPGLDSASDGVSASTERSLLGDPASVDAVSQVDALLYLMPHPGENDVTFLKEFAALFDGSNLGAVNIMGVLSKIDQLDGAGRSDPWVEATRLAAKKSEQLAGVVDHVIPVSGLVGQASAAGGYREHHTPWIRTLAAADPAALGRALRRTDRFRNAEGLGIDAPARHELLRVLGTWGLGHAVEAYRQGSRTTPALVAYLRRLSNLDELAIAVDGKLASGATLVRTANGLDELERIVYRAGAQDSSQALAGIRDEITSLRTRPELHRITEVQVLRSFDPVRSRLTAEQQAEVLLILREADVRRRLRLPPDASTSDLDAAVADRATVWRSVENDSRTRRRDRAVAAVIRRSFELHATGGRDG